MDMHSGGGLKEKYCLILIEAPEEEAKIIFYNRFGHNPERVTCTCCGSDYSIDESETLGQATAYDRNCHWDEKKGRCVEKPRQESWWLGKYIPLNEFRKREDICIIGKEDIKDEERVGEVPKQGYVWVD